MKRILIFILILSKSYISYSQNLSENAQISLITCNPGNELYSVFGHSAIRILDNNKGLDRVYNYGTFDFNTPNFYFKFVRAHLNYQLSAYSMQSFMAEYEATNRSVFEQVLILSQSQKEQIFNFLEYNRQPENKYYQYDFFFDNCASRIRDVFQSELGDSLKFDVTDYHPKSFRDILEPYLAPHAWSRFGINLVLGDITDRKASLSESMFLPDYLKTAFENAKLSGKLLALPPKVLFKQRNIINETPLYERPIFIFSILLILVMILTFFEIKYKRRFKLFDFLFFLSLGIVGIILFLLWFATDHTAVVQNWNLIWAVPSHFFIAFWMFRKRKTLWLKLYFLISGIAASSVLILWFLIPQHLDFALIPLLITMAVREFNVFRYY